MNELQKVFDYEGRQVRTITINGVPYFFAKDLCDVLEIENSRMAMQRLDDDEKDTVSLTDGVGRPHVYSVVNEPGMYGLILGSRKPEAKAFKRWIKHDVLPQISKTGAYTGNKSSATLLHMMTAELVKHEQQIEVLNQRMDYTDARFEETEDTFIKTLSEPSDRATFTRKVRELAKLRFAGRIHDAYNVVYQVVKEKYGVDVTARTMNERRRLQQERREQGLKPYAQSTLETKVSQVEVLERLGMLDDAMKIVVGSITKYWKQKGRDNTAEEVC